MDKRVGPDGKASMSKPWRFGCFFVGCRQAHATTAPCFERTPAFNTKWVLQTLIHTFIWRWAVHVHQMSKCSFPWCKICLDRFLHESLTESSRRTKGQLGNNIALRWEGQRVDHAKIPNIQVVWSHWNLWVPRHPPWNWHFCTWKWMVGRLFRFLLGR